MYVSVFSYRLTLVACLGMLLLSACRGSKEVLVEEDPRSAMEKQMDAQTQELAQYLSDGVVERIPGGIRITFYEAVLFAFDSAELSEAAFERLDFFAESMHKYPGTQVLIVGHSDATGEEAYNQIRTASSTSRAPAPFRCVSQSRRSAAFHGRFPSRWRASCSPGSSDSGCTTRPPVRWIS